MSYPLKDSYITKWLPLVGGFRPEMVIRSTNNHVQEPRKRKHYVMNEEWLKKEMERCQEAKIKCFIVYKVDNLGKTFMALKEGELE